MVAALVSEFGDSGLPACTGDKQFCFSLLVGYGTKGRFLLVAELPNLNKSILRHHRLVGFVDPLGRRGIELTEKDSERRGHEIAFGQSEMVSRSTLGSMESLVLGLAQRTVARTPRLSYIHVLGNQKNVHQNVALQPSGVPCFSTTSDFRVSLL